VFSISSLAFSEPGVTKRVFGMGSYGGGGHSGVDEEMEELKKLEVSMVSS